MAINTRRVATWLAQIVQAKTAGLIRKQDKTLPVIYHYDGYDNSLFIVPKENIKH